MERFWLVNFGGTPVLAQEFGRIVNDDPRWRATIGTKVRLLQGPAQNAEFDIMSPSHEWPPEPDYWFYWNCQPSLGERLAASGGSFPLESPMWSLISTVLGVMG